MREGEEVKDDNEIILQKQQTVQVEDLLEELEDEDDDGPKEEHKIPVKEKKNVPSYMRSIKHQAKH